MTHLLMIAVVLLAGCNVLPVHYSDQAHWALIENPVSQKCIEAHIGEGSIGSVGLMSFFSGVNLEGKDLTYKSYGQMCDNAPTP